MSKRYGINCGDIDVAMIVYNEETIISETIHALKYHGFNSFVVLDMESVDRTRSILQDHLAGLRLKLYKFPRTSLLKHGFAEARNVCATFCQRRWTLFVDADEILIGGVIDGFVEVERPEPIADLYSVERRNLSSFSTQGKLIGSVERHNRMYRTSPAVRWVGYIHEELHGVARVASTAETRLVFEHHSAVKQEAELEAKNGLYATMLMRGLRDADVREGTNEWHYKVFVPNHLELLRARASSYVLANDLDASYHPDHLSVPDIRDVTTEQASFVATNPDVV